MTVPERRWHVTRFGVYLCELTNENAQVCVLRNYTRHGTKGPEFTASRLSVFPTLDEAAEAWTQAWGRE